MFAELQINRRNLCQFLVAGIRCWFLAADARLSLQVFGNKDTDGFYRAEIRDRVGLIPCNMVSEIQTEDDEMMDQLLKQGFLPLNTPVEKLGETSSCSPCFSFLPPLCRSELSVTDTPLSSTLST